MEPPGVLVAPRLEADAVIGSVDEAVLDDGILAVNDIYTVIVPERTAVDGDPVDVEILTTVDDNGPECRITDVDTLHFHVLAVHQKDCSRAACRTAELERVIDETVGYLAEEIVCDLTSLSVDDAKSRDSYVLGILGSDETIGPVHPVIIVRVWRTHKDCTLPKVKSDIGLEMYSTCKITADLEMEGSATSALMKPIPFWIDLVLRVVPLDLIPNSEA